MWVWESWGRQVSVSTTRKGWKGHIEVGCSRVAKCIDKSFLWTLICITCAHIFLIFSVCFPNLNTLCYLYMYIGHRFNHNAYYVKLLLREGSLCCHGDGPYTKNQTIGLQASFWWNRGSRMDIVRRNLFCIKLEYLKWKFVSNFIFFLKLNNMRSK